MTKAIVLVNDALEMLNVSSGMMPADPGQQQRMFRTLQRMFDVLPARNIYLHMQRPSTVNAELREPGYATELLVPILATMAAPYFQVDPAPIYGLYSDALNVLQRKTGRPIQTRYVAGLPGGAGNYYDDGIYFYPGDNQYQFTQYDESKKGEAKLYSVDFSDEATKRNTSVTSVDWANIGEVSATLSGITLAGQVAEAMLDFNRAGNVLVRARATFANGERYDGLIKITVVDVRAG